MSINRKKIYMYPMRTHVLMKENNPYLYNLCQSLLKENDIINYGQALKFGFLDVLFYFFKAEIFYFNWIEDISNTKSYLFVFFCKVLKFFSKKIVWTHHNVHSHAFTKSKSNGLIVRYLTKNADLIIFHTKESYNVLNCSPDKKEILYYFHPLFEQPHPFDMRRDNKYDLLIWGNVRKSKGIHEFLEFLQNVPDLNLRILIIGKFESDFYYQEIINLINSNNITVRDEFISLDQLDILHHNSAFIFFPYTGSSVLNSGALITSLPKGTPIIGPLKGAFKELGELKIIQTYRTFDEVLKIASSQFRIEKVDRELVQKFCAEHSWESFAIEVTKRLNQLK